MAKEKAPMVCEAAAHEKQRIGCSSNVRHFYAQTLTRPPPPPSPLSRRPPRYPSMLLQLVIEYSAFQEAGHFPRSSERLTRPYKQGDVVFFISHRWWGADQQVPHPDDEYGSKYAILLRG